MLKLNIGLSKKVGEPNYGSRGASVNLELEVETALVHQPDELQERIRRLFRLAKSSVDEELNGHSDPYRDSAQNGNHEPRGNGYRTTSRNDGRPATASQARAIRAIAGRQRVDLPQLLGDRYGVGRPEDLSLADASQLIDELKAPANGSGGRR